MIFLEGIPNCVPEFYREQEATHGADSVKEVFMFSLGFTEQEYQAEMEM